MFARTRARAPSSVQPSGNVASDFEPAFEVATADTRKHRLYKQARALAVRLSIIDDDDVAFPRAQDTVNNGSQIDGHGNTHVTNTPESLSVRRQGSVGTHRATGPKCVICTNHIYGDEFRAPCGDFYHRECIVALFEAAVQDKSLVPLRCCGRRIILASVQQFLSPALVELYHAKDKELGTLKRVYCANPSCRLFLCAHVRGAFWRWLPHRMKYKCCPDCGTVTCTRLDRQDPPPYLGVGGEVPPPYWAHLRPPPYPDESVLLLLINARQSPTSVARQPPQRNVTARAAACPSLPRTSVARQPPQRNVMACAAAAHPPRPRACAALQPLQRNVMARAAATQELPGAVNCTSSWTYVAGTLKRFAPRHQKSLADSELPVLATKEVLIPQMNKRTARVE
ncbi:predicted protein [Postia placenta Mad-698-R]|uniref:RING-type domain-containing protein n=1 Tax=Postia placenta MAD-698-R-SB12 TaxID=670580 RepID=A0A1X6N3W5_9APHY|nr:hypothetical protein POSPLADRAFT_1139948 [Postia placenta MAD-698-R-SB12]EED85866.1 predicted protein [Postia placenta Mad-698-R]OSX63339.1 hypothetical protein POSPLADRAFT_1139948 [Postia placenta MAD-698-R-SB12]